MVNVEELDPAPFIELLDQIGLPTEVEEKPLAFVPPAIAALDSVD